MSYKGLKAFFKQLKWILSKNTFMYFSPKYTNIHHITSHQDQHLFYQFYFACNLYLLKWPIDLCEA